LHVLTTTIGSGKTFFVKYITQHFQTLGKNVLLSAIMNIITFLLCSIVIIVHIAFHIPVQGYLSILPTPNNVIKKLKIVNLMIIDEMSMMTSNILCIMEQHLK
jgi:hypothetical protein